MRHSLSDESTHAATVLGSWVALFPDLIPCDDIVTLFKDKSKHMGKGKTREGAVTGDDNMIDVDMDDILSTT
jgi:hypothetical protein